MTLVLTEISEFGIAMVADSAVTVTATLPSGASVQQVLNGARKLQIIDYLGAGLSMWGVGSIRNVPSDLWIEDFIDRHGNIATIDEFANELARELQQAIGNVRRAMGFHLAGYVEQDGQAVPTLYHVRNVDGDFLQGYTYHDFIPGPEPSRYLTLRNGDYGTYAILSQRAPEALSIINAAINIDIPSPDLVGRMAYNAAWVRFISDLYASSGRDRTIGGDVASLGIRPDGGMIFFPR